MEINPQKTTTFWVCLFQYLSVLSSLLKKKAQISFTQFRMDCSENITGVENNKIFFL